MRIACLYVPNFLVAAACRGEPELRERAVAIVANPGPRAAVLAVSEAAARLGAAPGLSAAQARAIDASLVLRCASDDCRRAAHAALGDAADSFSPRVEEAEEGEVYLDASGLSAMFAGESAAASAMARRAARLGIEAHVGIAASKVAASLAARNGGGVTVIPPDEEWGVLAPLPVGLLRPSPALAATLRRWGLRTIGEFAALPAGAVGARLGPEGLALARRARGEDDYPLAPRPAPVRFEEGMEMEYGIDAVEPCVFVVHGLLDRLTARLEARGLVCGDLRLCLRLANRARDERTVLVAAPSNDAKALLALVRLHLESHPPAAAIEAVRIAAVPERLRAAQLDLFRPPGPAPERLAVTLARLTAICGADRVGAPAALDSYWPDAYGVEPFALRASMDEAVPRFAAAPLAVRALRPPRSVEAIRDRGRIDYFRGEGCCGRVVHMAGPWRVEADWWNERAGERDYYDVQLSDGGVYRMYRERGTEAWFVDGVYD